MKTFPFALSVLAATALAAVPAFADEAKPMAAKPPASATAKLSDPGALKEKAPTTFKAKFETTQGTFVIEVNRDWSPNGADRFYNLVKSGYFDGVKFFRVHAGFVVQWGIHGDPSIATKWLQSNIPDDPVKQSNTKGMITFAKATAPNSRSVQFFINLRDNSNLDGQGFSPFGKVTEGMDVVEKLYSGYGDGLPQGKIAEEGNAWLEQNYPKLDAIKKATIAK